MVTDERFGTIFDGGSTLGLGPGELLARFAARRDEAAVAVRARAVAARRRAVEGGDLPDVPATPAPDGLADLRAVFDEELARLPEKYRAPLVLCYLEGQTHDEAADQLGWPVGSVRSRLARGRDRLRGGLTRRGYAPSVLPVLSPAIPPLVAVSPSLRAAAVRLALAPLAGRPAGSAAVLLAQGTINSMFTTQIQTIAAIVAASLAVAGAGVLAAGPRGADGPPAVAAVPAPDAGPPRATPTAKDPADLTQKFWDVADFTDVEIHSSFQAEIAHGDFFEVRTTVETPAADLVRVVRDGKTLRVDLAHDRNVRVNEPLQVRIVLPALAGVALFEAAHATLTGEPAADQFKVRLDGASRLDGTIRAQHADFGATGSSVLTLRGSAEQAEVAASGGARLRLADFALGESKVELEGGSQAKVAVKSAGPFRATLVGSAVLEGSVESGPLDIRVEGAGRVTLAGKARGATLQAGGAARLDLAKLIATTADVRLDGAAAAVVDATARLTYDLGSISRLEYLGQPAELRGEVGSGAKLKRRD